MPKVSICIPTYNQTTYLVKTLDSVAAQTLQDIEIIVTDDSTTNDVESLVNTYRSIFGEKLYYQRNRPSLGSPENWNESIRLAKGEWIKLLHHDEWFTDPNALQTFVAAMEDLPKSNFGICQAITVHATSGKQWIHASPKSWRAEIAVHPSSLQLANLVGSPSNLIFRDTVKELFDKKLKWLVDVEFYIRLFKKYGEPTWVDHPLITSVTGATHNVTNDCIDDPQVQIFEHLYVYTLHKEKTGLLTKAKFYFHFIQLFRRFWVTSKQNIEMYGFRESLPSLVQTALIVAKTFRKN